ncbi:hypothetical protein FACS1894109_13140 [Spirochaetia bacterium]|nr:hypothetical protein FACS1894109_13140 [Spirochaetia bacterium]
MKNPITAFFGRGKSEREADQQKIATLENQVQKLSAMSEHGGGRMVVYSGSKYPGGMASPDPSLLLNNTASRHQIRTLSHTSTQTAALINRDIDTVVDSGLMVDAEPQTDIIGITPEEGSEWSHKANILFDLWAQDIRSSRSRTMNFYQAQRLMQRYLSRDGECFVLLSYSTDPQLSNPLQITIIDPDQIRDDGYTATAGLPFHSRSLLDGIVFNDEGVEVAYKIWNIDPKTDVPTMKPISKIGAGGRIFMTHGFEPEYTGQTRGGPRLLVSAQDLEKVLDLAIAEVNKSINQSNIAFTLKNDSDEPGEDPTLDTGAAGIRKAVEQYGNVPHPPADAQNVTEESVEPVYTEVPNTTFRKPGSVGVYGVGPHQQLIPFENTAPGTVFNAFVAEIFSYIAAANGQSIETVLMKFGENYSASRATLILTWRVACQRRYNLACFHLDVIYEMFLSECIASGKISAPGWEDPTIRLAWLRHRWNGSQMPAMDPTKEAAAAKLWRDLGSETGEEIALNHNGSSFKSNVSKLTKEMPELNAAIGTTAPTTEAKEEKDEDDERDGRSA